MREFPHTHPFELLSTLHAGNVNVRPLRMKTVFLSAPADKYLVLPLTGRNPVSEAWLTRRLVDKTILTAVADDIDFIKRPDTFSTQCCHRFDPNALHSRLLFDHEPCPRPNLVNFRENGPIAAFQNYCFNYSIFKLICQ